MRARGGARRAEGEIPISPSLEEGVQRRAATRCAHQSDCGRLACAHRQRALVCSVSVVERARILCVFVVRHCGIAFSRLGAR